MKHFAVVLSALVTVIVVAQGDDMYSDKYDNINLDEVLGSDRLLNNYFECLIAESDDKCTEDAQALKKVLSEMLSTDCAKCTDKQKIGIKKVIKHLVEFKPEFWKSLAAKYDTKDEFQKKYPEFAVKA